MVSSLFMIFFRDFVKISLLPFSNNTNVLKEYKGSYGLYTRFE